MVNLERWARGQSVTTTGTRAIRSGNAGNVHVQYNSRFAALPKIGIRDRAARYGIDVYDEQGRGGG